jgi:hypothetical protein
LKSRSGMQNVINRVEMQIIILARGRYWITHLRLNFQGNAWLLGDLGM